MPRTGNIRGKEYFVENTNLKNENKENHETNKNTAPWLLKKDQRPLDLMNRMKLHGMARAFRESLDSTMLAEAMTPDAFLSMLLAGEWDYRSGAASAPDPI